RKIGAGFLRQTIEIFERAPGYELARGHRARKILDRVVEFEHQGIRNSADLVEPALSPGPFFPGEMRLSVGGDDACEQRNEDDRGGGCPELVSKNQFRRSIPDRVSARGNWSTFQISPNVG